MIIDQSLQDRIELLEKIDNEKVQSLIRQRMKENPSKRAINHWLFSSSKINLQKINETNAIMSRVRKNNRDFSKTDSVKIAENILFKSLNKKLSYLDATIINYLCNEDESFASPDDVSFSLKLTEILDRNFGWYGCVRKNDFFIILSIKDKAKNGTLNNRDFLYLKNHFSSKINLLNKSSTFKVGDIAYYSFKAETTPCIIFEPAELESGFVKIKLLMNDSVVELVDFEISSIKKTVRNKNA